jgi:hypothetical protein
MVVFPYKGETTLRPSKDKGNDKTCRIGGMSTTKDGVKARIVTNRERIQPRSGWVKHHSQIEMGK